MRTPRPLARASRALLCSFAAILPLVLLPACETTTPAPMEPFKRHRLESLSRALDAARQAQQASRDGISQSFEQTSLDLLPVDAGRQQLEDAYDLARRDLATNQTRVRVARERLTQAERRGTDLFAEWDKEIGYYADSALEAQARAGYNQAKARFDEALQALVKANELTPPLLVELSDRMLYFKHHRDQPDLVEPVRTPQRVEAMARAREAMSAATDAASVAVSRFAEAEAGGN